LVELGVNFTYYRMDLFTGDYSLSSVHEVLKGMTNQRTVPYVYINGMLVGGCDATKAIIASGEFDRLLGGDVPAPGDEEAPLTSAGDVPRVLGIDESAPHVIGAIFEFPNTVDIRVIRLVGFQVMVITIILAALAYKKEQSYHWLAVGLLTDFCLRFYGGAGISPLGSIAMLVAAIWDFVGPRFFGRETGPVWGAGPPKQFAVFVGVFFSAMIVIFEFTHVWQAATVFAAVLAFFAALESLINFCAGCWVFQKAIRSGIVPDTVYIVHVNTLPETKYAWNDQFKVVNPPKPERLREAFRDHPAPTRIDLKYKTGKTDDWEREDFAYVKHSKIAFMSSVIGVAAIPALFKFMSIASTIGTPAIIWQVLTVLSLIHTVIFTAPYLAKMVLYPHKIRAEWMHPAMGNAFPVPSMTLCVYAFLAWDQYSTPLARVLWWAGSSTACLLAIILVGNWMATLRHDGHVNGGWMMPPVGLYIAAVTGPIIDPGYTSVSFLFFAFATIMWVTIFVIIFQRFALGHNMDPRMRMFAAIWFAAPAVSSIAWTVLNSNGASFAMDSISQTLFYVAISMALVCAWMVWRGFLYAPKFFMQMWAWGFSTAALAWAGVLYDATINTALTKVLAVALISLACIVCFVLTMRTFVGIARLKVFIPEHKWGPMSHLPLAQDAMRALLDHITTSAAALADAPSNGRLAAKFMAQWRTFTTVNTFYSTLKGQICFPQIGMFFPGHQDQATARNDAMIAQQKEVDAIVAAGPKSDPAAFSAAVKSFADMAVATFDHMEDHIKPVVRRYIPGPVQKKIMNDCWDDAPPEGWFAVLPAVVQHLPMHAQRVTYIRAFLWAMPERCQQIGTMVALGVDPVTWYRLRKSVPEIIPRGEAGWKRF